MSKRSERRKKLKQPKVEVEVKSEPKKEKHSFFVNIYDKHYKLLLIIPLLMIILAIAQIGYQISTTGYFINKGISLSGGTSITITKDMDVSFMDLELYLNSEFLGFDTSVRELTSSGRRVGLIIDSTVEDFDALIIAIQEKTGPLSEDDYTRELMGASLGEQFFQQTFKALILALIFMGIVVLIYFRSFIPSVTVMLSAVFDVVVTVAIVNVMGIKLSTAGIAAFLMLIGYSVDTDILLSTKLLKEKGSYLSRIQDAMKTGFVMTATTIFAILAALFLTQSIVIKQILTIVLIGLLTDVISTWIQNAGMMRWYLENKGNKK
jgi:preprotein translocase subunit SecF